MDQFVTPLRPENGDDSLIIAGVSLSSRLFIGTAGYPGSQLWREQLVPIAVVSPVVVSVGIIALLLSSLSSWAWILIVPVLSVVGLLFRLTLDRRARTPWLLFSSFLPGPNGNSMPPLLRKSYSRWPNNRPYSRRSIG